MHHSPAAFPHPKPNHKAWWHHFALNSKPKKDPALFEGPYRAEDTADHPVFGKPLKESLKYASVQISTANANGELYVWGYIPVVVAKCGLYLKENATEVPGTFRVNGSNKRMRDLQAVFETPPRYGKSLDWRKESYTTHDVASVFRRYLTQMPEPVIPYDMYHLFRDAMAKEPFREEEVIATYKSLIRRMPRPNQYLLLYVLDLLSVFARKSDKNLMTATNLAVIFRPGLISHPQHEMSPQEHALSQKVLEFLIAQQDWFMLDISPPTPPNQSVVYEGPSGSGGSSGRGVGGGNGNNNSGSGRWREATGTPSRQGTAAPSDNPGGGGSGSASGTQSAAWHSNAEAGPSTPRQRALTGTDRAVPSPSAAWAGGVQFSSPQHHPQRQHQRQRSMSHSPSRSPEKQAMLGTAFQGQFAEQIWPNSNSLPPSPLSATFPPNTSSSSRPSYGHGQHAKSPSAGAHANGSSTSATPIYSRFSHPPQSPTSPIQGYPDPSSQRPQTHPPSTPSSQRSNPFQSPHHHHQFQSQPQYHHHHHHPNAAESSHSDVDEHMVIPSDRPSSPQSEDDLVSIGPFGSDGGLDGGWKWVQSPPSPSWGSGDAPNGPGGAAHGGGFLSLGKVGRGKEKEKVRDVDPRMKMMRRRTAVDPGELAKRTPDASQSMRGIGNGTPITSSPLSRNASSGGGSGATVVRSRTLPSSSRRKNRGMQAETEDEDELEYDDEKYEHLPPLGMGVEKENIQEYGSSREGAEMKLAKSKERRVLKKQRRVVAQTDSRMASATTTTTAMGGHVSGLPLRS